MAFVPIFASNVQMNVINSTAKFASNVQKNAVPVPKVAQLWQLKISSVKQNGVGNSPALFFILS